MEVVAATPNSNGVPPFHNHDVHEWSRIDSLSGVLERARLETDHWAASTNNSSHNYGKVVDTRARSNADGAIQQARRQLEVFESSVPGGRLQVIKSHTVSSSRWTSKPPLVNDHKDVTPHFTDLELPLNPLDLTSQKSRATVGRSVGRRPPSRPRNRDDTLSNSQLTFGDAHTTAAANLHRISRLCNQVHENAVKQTFGKYHKPPIHERESGDGVEIVEIECTNSENTNEHINLIRTKSTSSENINLTPEKEKQNKSVEDLEDLEQLQNWRRTSKIRRSLHIPAQTKTSPVKPLDVPINTGSVRKIREDLETGRRLNTALRGNNVDLEALDQILQLITSPTEIRDNRFEEPEKDEQITSKKLKRHSFVTVESLQEVRGRLRRTSSPVDDTNTTINSKKDDEADDGIVTEDSLNKQIDDMPSLDSSSPHSRVRSYVYGMEALMNKKPILGTGSLESRTSRQINGISINRNEDWYNRRKSYGFEQVHTQEPTNTISKNKTFMDSSTDSGICRSSEIMLVPTTNRSSTQLNKCNDLNDSQKDEIFSRINKHDIQNENGVSNIGSVRRYASIFEQKRDNAKMKDYEGTKITIPIVRDGSSQLDCSPFSYNKNAHNGEVKRHSIAVDESRYVTQTANSNYRRTSLAVNDKSDPYDGLDDEFSQGKKHKKVEFCKTEVHFAVDSGRVNIVATDDKPPPTNNFRRRRRNSATLYNNLLTDANKNGLPVLHFGDSSYEKNMFNFVDHEDELNLQTLQITDSDSKPNDQLTNSTVTVSTNQPYYNYCDDTEEEQKDNAECEIPKSILKNKPIKPKPYLLGDDPYCIDAPVNDEKKIWGVTLKPVHSLIEPQMWKSTVTLKNTLYDKNRQVVQNDLLVSPNEIKEEQSTLDQSNNIRIISSQLNTARPMDDLRKPELKGYSTKVNIGSGEAVVIEGSLNVNQTLTEVKKESFTGTATVSSSPSFTEKNNRNIKIINKTPNSPVVLRKPVCDSKRQELKVNYSSDKLSSPSLVEQNLTKADSAGKIGGWKKGITSSDGSATMSKLWEKRSPIPKIHTYDTLHTVHRKSHTPSPTTENLYCTIKEKDSDIDSEKQSSPSRSVLRNPRRSEMAYFGVKVSPSPKSTRKNETKPPVRAGVGYFKPRAKLPIYENVDEMKRPKHKTPVKDFDSSILDELTKAADQILQAVNGYAEEVEKQSLEEQKKNMKKEKLDTISETKSWKQRNLTKHNCNDTLDLTRPKLIHTPSTSSIDSISESRKATNQRNVVDSDKYKKKSGSDTSSTRAATKARRLQRASSREALLQSHGSSSEDLPVSVNVPVRKSRVVRKTKTSQVVDTHKIDSRSKRLEEKAKCEERVPVGALPTIRHKTAVSTIRSTAEKAQYRERSHRSKNDDTKKKSTLRKEPSRSSASKGDRNTNSSTREAITHRISTANIKKCANFKC